MTGRWTQSAKLPGGDLPGTLPDYVAHLQANYPDLPTSLLMRLSRSYGTEAERLLGGVQNLGDLGETFGADLTAREVDYLIAREWARSAEDILFRRSKLGLHIGKAGTARLESYVRERLKPHKVSS